MKNTTFWTLLNEIQYEVRAGKTDWTTSEIVARLSIAEPKATASELWFFCKNFIKKPSEIEGRKLNEWIWNEELIFTLGNGSPIPYGVIPAIAANFITDYLSALKPKRLLLPWVLESFSDLALLNAMPTVQEAVALSPNTRRFWQSQLFEQLAASILGWGKTVDWFNFRQEENPQSKRLSPDLVETFNDFKGRFDAIICYTPLGERDFLEQLLVIGSGTRLSPNGVGLFVVSSSFFPSTRASTHIYEHLQGIGVSVEAALSIPREHRGGTSVNLCLIVVKRCVQGRLFVGELQSDLKRRKFLQNNFERKIESNDLSLGTLVEKEGFSSFEQIKEAKEYQTQIAQQGLPIVNLSTLIVEVNRCQREDNSSFPDRANSLYLSLSSSSESVTSIEQFRLVPHSYLQLVLKQESVNAEFLAKFFNSDLGLKGRLRYKLIQRGAPTSFAAVARVLKEDVVLIPLPALSIQIAAIEADTSLRDLATDVENLRKQLWNRPVHVQKVRKAIERVNREETFEGWLKTLPFPLASILWNYHTAAHNPKEQFELLLKFFEGLAEFHATILLSAARRDDLLWIDTRSYLAKERERFETSSFATWIELTAFISKRLREFWSDTSKAETMNDRSGRERCEQALGSSRREVIEGMLSKELLGVLRSANQFRNTYVGHYGVLGEDTAASLLVQLRSYLSEVRSSFGQIWDDYQLLLPTNRSEWTGQRHEVVVNILQGLNTPFLKETCKLNEPLKRNTLYLLDKGGGNAVELLPLLKISNAPKDAANACYFYNRKQPNGARYVSYHFEKQADLTYSVAEMEHLFHDLFGNAGQQ